MDCGYKKKQNADKKYSHVESNLISQNHRNLQKWGSWLRRCWLIFNKYELSLSKYINIVE